MPYRLVKGEFHLFYQGQKFVGAQPDGDSIWFKPNQAKRLKGLGGRDADLNAGGFAQLRVEAIDALELHYKGAHQESGHGIAARDFTVSSLGFKSVTYSGGGGLSVKSASPHPRPGYILTKAVDPYGRPVSFVFAGATARADGADVFLDVPLLDTSLNAKLAKSGQAYPAFYTGLPVDLRRRVAQLAATAKNGKKGIWPDDRTRKGATVSGLAGLEKQVLWPKLFRRLVSYFKDGHAGLSKWDGWLRADTTRDDALWIVSSAELGNLHDVVEVSGNKVSMNHAPEDLIIVPR
jgi:endonuclease YncB( thermonuclease family)